MLAAGCVGFGDLRLRQGSKCAGDSPDLIWLSRPAQREPFSGPTRYFDPALDDPALAAGAWVKGEQRFEWRAQGPHLVEVFLVAEQPEIHDFHLWAGDRPADARHNAARGGLRLRPRPPTQRLSLSAMVTGPATLAVRSTAPRYVVSAIRWRPAEEFEQKLVPEWRERVRKMIADPFFENLRTGRRARIEQLAERLALSRVPEVRKEAVLNHTRAAYWVAAENHEPFDLERTAVLFREAWKLAPGQGVLRQMISASCKATSTPRGMAKGDFCGWTDGVRWEAPVDAGLAGAPEWAAAQWRLRARLEAITRWWVEQRQAANGELGGGWGDDVEMLRHWGPVALGLGSEVATRGLRRIADGVWNSGQLEHGYDRGISDVEHSSEPTTDTLPLLAAAFPDDAGVLDRLRQTAACAENWITRQPDGRWRFRSSWFNCREADTSPPRAVDVHLNVRAMGPALWYAYLARDPKLIDRIGKWASSWREAARSTAHGKPAGIFPSVVRSADGSYLIGSDRWDKPQAEWDYFQWSDRSQEALESLMLAAHDLTGDAGFLAAKAPVATLAGDQVLARMGELAAEAEREVRVNFDIYTSEVMYTDRVYYPVAPEYWKYLFGGEAPRGERYPIFAVTWPQAEGRFARAVLGSSDSRLELALYNFEDREVWAPMRIWRLRPGVYRVQGRSVTLARLPAVIEVRLPPRAVSHVTVAAR